MIVCPNCNHSNPEGATQCEACYTPLPVTTACPNCGASVQADAAFCGQCGFNLRGTTSQPKVGNMPDITPLPDIPDLVTPDPLIATPPVTPAEVTATVVGQVAVETGSTNSPDPVSPPPVAEVSISPPPSATPGSDKTQLQQQNARLLHVQTNTPIELPQNLSVVHLGKPNDQIPPDIDVSGFPNSEVVSRVHADIRIEGDAYYIEDVGSSNGTYINHTPLPSGNRHRLRPGDRIGLGKGDLMTFLFQLS